MPRKTGKTRASRRPADAERMLVNLQPGIGAFINAAESKE
jgi:hypothetical protein